MLKFQSAIFFFNLGNWQEKQSWLKFAWNPMNTARMLKGCMLVFFFLIFILVWSCVKNKKLSDHGMLLEYFTQKFNSVDLELSQSGLLLENGGL